MNELGIPLRQRGFLELAALRAALTDLGAEGFCQTALGGHPALIVSATEGPPLEPASSEADLLFQQTHEEDEADFRAIYLGAVGLLQKRAGSPFPHMINLGRAPNCDVVLLLPTVSKLHAYFQLGPSGWGLVDSRSRNGTFINGERLEAGEARALREGDLLSFGKEALSFRFCSPEQLCVELRQG